MSDNRLEPKPWRAKQVLDPEIEKCANDSIVQMVFDYDLPCVAHMIFSNYTWTTNDVHKLIEYYGQLSEAMQANLAKLQRNCEPNEFSRIMQKHSRNTLPIYGKSVDVAQLDANCRSRCFHDAREYLARGSAHAEELNSFVYAVMSEALEPVFSTMEIKRVLRNLELMESLERTCSRDDELGSDVDQEFQYECMKLLQNQRTNFPNFYPKLSAAITNFIVFFALHTLRHNCYATFCVDKQLKFYQREMYNQAVEDSKKSRSDVSMDNKQKIKKSVKRERRESDDFCEVIEEKNVLANKKVKSEFTEAAPTSSGSQKNQKNEEDDLPEKNMLDDLEKSDLPVFFKTKFRKLVESNQDLRDEIKDYKTLLKMHFAKQKY